MGLILLTSLFYFFDINTPLFSRTTENYSCLSGSHYFYQHGKKKTSNEKQRTVIERFQVSKFGTPSSSLSVLGKIGYDIFLVENCIVMKSLCWDCLRSISSLI